MGDLLACKIVTAEGKRLGHIADVELTPGPEYRVTKLLYGQRGWLHRLHVLNPFVDKKSHHKPDSVPWDAVDRIEGSTVILKPGCEPKPHEEQ
ncbi:MAG: PRC-barrel domain-containing protein [Chloroflexota bacterium]|nr:PRC-barrel domain-containing protein [Chloroflexota bacterium]